MSADALLGDGVCWVDEGSGGVLEGRCGRWNSSSNLFAGFQVLISNSFATSMSPGRWMGYIANGGVVGSRASKLSMVAMDGA